MFPLGRKYESTLKSLWKIELKEIYIDAKFFEIQYTHELKRAGILFGC